MQFDGKDWSAPRLKALLARCGRAQDLPFRPLRHGRACSTISASLPQPVYCTKIASKLVRTYTDRHGLKDLCASCSASICPSSSRARTGAADKLTDQQKHYAASDVLHLHALKAKLDAMLQREGRTTEAEACFRFLAVRAGLDLAGFEDIDIFAH